MNEVPEIIEMLYHAWVSVPDSGCWPAYLKNDPGRAQGLSAFYQGLCFGIRLSEACHPGL